MASNNLSPQFAPVAAELDTAVPLIEHDDNDTSFDAMDRASDAIGAMAGMKAETLGDLKAKGRGVRLMFVQELSAGRESGDWMALESLLRDLEAMDG